MVLFLSCFSCNEVDVLFGWVVYIVWINEKGGFEVDFMVIWFVVDCFFVVVGENLYGYIEIWMCWYIGFDEFVMIIDIMFGII